MKKIIALVCVIALALEIGAIFDATSVWGDVTETNAIETVTTINPTTKPISHPRGTIIKKIKSAKKSLKIYWRKQAKNTNGYHIQCSRKKNFIRLAREIFADNPYKTFIKIKKLKKKKNYYVRIRTYKVVEGRYYYSGWSKAKNKKTK